jgi:drug/metabolite transporter (DMT)-like permease
MTVLWSLNFVVAKIALRELPALVTAGLRTLLAGALILPLYWWETRKRRRPAWTADNIPMLLFLSVFGVALNQVFFVLGIGRTTVAHAAVVIGLSPLLVLLVAAMIGLETITAGRAAGMVTALSGVALLQVYGQGGAGASLAGDVFIFLAATMFALFTVFGKRMAQSFTSITLNTFAYVAGGAMLLPVTIWQAQSVALREVSWTAWASLLYMAAFPSVLCYLIYYYALTWIPASRVAAFSYLQPLLATFLAAQTLGERPTGALITGAVLVLAGVMMAERW